MTAVSSKKNSDTKRVWTMTACFASSVDGIIHPIGAGETYQKISSNTDIAHLKEQRDQHDLLLMGAATFRHYPKAHTGHRTEPPLVIFTRGKAPFVDIPPDSPAFYTDNQTTITIFSARIPNESLLEKYPPNVSWKPFPMKTDNTIDWAAFAQAEPFASAPRILCEGGGHLFGMLLKAQWIDGLYLTVSPLLLGGRKQGASPLLSGDGFTLDEAPRCELQADTTRILENSNEIIAHYHITYPALSTR
jgi:riboflavin biosynthesis pyrimidine reductase